MSWQKCVTAETYSLAVPPLVVVALNVIHLLMGLSSFGLELPPDCTVVLWLSLFRSWRQTLAFVQLNAGRVFWLDTKGRIYFDEAPRSLGSHNALDGVRLSPEVEYHSKAGSVLNRLERLRPVAVTTLGVDGQKHYTCCRSVRVPGCVAITLVKNHGKPLEILVFYRYHQRQFYRRLIRHLAYC